MLHSKVWEALGSKGFWLRVELEVERLRYRGGLVNKKPATAMSIKANHLSLALITFFGLWKYLEMGSNPRIIYTARS